jgi:serine/threonine protein phosphatase PrpC
VCSVQCAECSVQCAVCSVQCVLCAVCSVQCAVLLIHRPLTPSKTYPPRTYLLSPQVLYRAFLEVDAEYLASTHSNAGSTANVLCWDKKAGVGYLANSGDTRTVVCGRNGIARDVTRDRKATTPEEIARVARAGGFVANGRVMGSLAVARAFGDKALKKALHPQGVPPSMLGDARVVPRTAVTSAPEVTTVCPRPSDQFMIMATDGLWDVYTSQEAVEMVAAKATSIGLLGEGRFLRLRPYCLLIPMLVQYPTGPAAPLTLHPASHPPPPTRTEVRICS